MGTKGDGDRPCRRVGVHIQRLPVGPSRDGGDHRNQSLVEQRQDRLGANLVDVADKTNIHERTVDGALVDIGLVGDIDEVRSEPILSLLDQGLIPVISTVARGADGETLNVNADTAAGAIAVALGAHKLVMLTDVEGLYRDWPTSDEVIASLTTSELRDLLPTLASGMVPKMEACLRSVDAGVSRAHVIDGRVRHSLLVEVFTDQGVGTMVVPGGGSA